jgi:hypothetical protein
MADAIAPIGMKMVVDLSDFSPKLKKGADDLDMIDKKTKTTAESMSSSFQAIQSKLSGVFTAGMSGGFGGAFSAATGQLEGFLSKLSGAAGPWGVFSAAGIGALTAIGAAASATAGRIESMNRLGRVLGMSNQEAQTLVGVFANSGLDADSARTAALRFSSHLGSAAADANSPEARAFHTLNLDPQALATRTPLDALEQVVERLHGINNPADRASASMAIFNRQFVDMAELVEMGAAGIERVRREVENNGTTDKDADFQKGTTRQNREARNLEAAGGTTIFGALTHQWDFVATQFSRAYADLNTATAMTSALHANGQSYAQIASMFATGETTAQQAQILTLGAQQGLRPGQAPRRITFDAYTAPPPGPTQMQIDADKLASKWTDQARFYGQSARDVAIIQASEAGITDETIRRLHAESDALTALERRADLEKEIASTISQSQTVLEKYESTAENITRARRDLGMLRPEDRQRAGSALDRAQADAFLRAEASLGSIRSDPSSYSVGGIDPRSLEGQKFIDGSKIRDELTDIMGGDDPQARVNAVFEALKESDKRKEALLQGIIDVLRARPNNQDVIGDFIQAAPNFI